MRTNLEKWNYYWGELNKRAVQYCNSKFVLPDKVYKVYNNGSIDEYLIQSVEYNFGITFHGKKPKNTDIDTIKEMYETEIVFNDSKFICKVKAETHYTWISILDIQNNKGVYSNKEDADIMSAKKTFELNQKKDFEKKNMKGVDYNYSSNGYTYLGWMNGWTENPAEYNLCSASKHILIEVSRSRRGCENVVDCPICKIYWKYDSSD